MPFRCGDCSGGCEQHHGRGRGGAVAASMIDHSLCGWRRARKTRRQCHRKITRLWNEIKRVWQLVGPFGESSFEVTHLIADVDDDRVALVLQLLPLRRLEIGSRFRREVV